MSLAVGRIADVDQMAEMSLADANTNTNVNKAAVEQQEVHGQRVIDGERSVGLIALIPIRAVNAALLAAEAMELGATVIELTTSAYVGSQASDNHGALDEIWVAEIIAEVATKTGLPVITSGLTEPSSIALDPGPLHPGPLDPSEPATLSLRLDAISALSAAGEHVVATILGNSDAEVAVMAALAVSRGARTLRSVRVTPAIRAALVTAAIVDAG